VSCYKMWLAKGASETIMVSPEDGRVGILDQKEGWAISPDYESLYKVSDCWVARRLDGAPEWVLLDNSGKQVLKRGFASFGRGLEWNGGDSADRVFPILVRWGESGGEGANYVTRNGDRILRGHDYNDLAAFRKGIAKVVKNGQCGAIDASGEMVVPLKFDEISTITGTRKHVVVKDDGLWGVWSVGQDRWHVEPLFRNVGFGREGIAMVCDKNGWGLYDISERHFVLSPEYIALKDYHMNGRCWGMKAVDGEPLFAGIILGEGRVTEFQYDRVSPFFKGLAWVKVGGTGEFIYVNSEYEAVLQVGQASSATSVKDDGVVYVERDGRALYFGINGKVLWAIDQRKLEELQK